MLLLSGGVSSGLAIVSDLLVSIRDFLCDVSEVDAAFASMPLSRRFRFVEESFVEELRNVSGGCTAEARGLAKVGGAAGVCQ